MQLGPQSWVHLSIQRCPLHPPPPQQRLFCGGAARTPPPLCRPLAPFLCSLAELQGSLHPRGLPLPLRLLRCRQEVGSWRRADASAAAVRASVDDGRARRVGRRWPGEWRGRTGSWLPPPPPPLPLPLPLLLVLLPPPLPLPLLQRRRCRCRCRRCRRRRRRRRGLVQLPYVRQCKAQTCQGRCTTNKPAAPARAAPPPRAFCGSGQVGLCCDAVAGNSCCYAVQLWLPLPVGRRGRGVALPDPPAHSTSAQSSSQGRLASGSLAKQR